MCIGLLISWTSFLNLLRFFRIASVAWWSQFLVPGSIPSATRFSNKLLVWNGALSASWGSLRSCLNAVVAAPVYKSEINGRDDLLHWPYDTLYPQKLAWILPTSGGHLLCIVCLWTKSHWVYFSNSCLCFCVLDKDCLCGLVVRVPGC
jgi:hypothetical protein